MLRRIAQLLASALAALEKGLLWTVETAGAVARFPFDLLFGGQPMPHYEPEFQRSDILEIFKEQRKAAEVHRLNRDGIDRVLEFCRAHPSDRPTMKLPSDLRPSVRAALLTMNQQQLRTLASAGIGGVRRFLDGKRHGITGVPEFGQGVPAAANDEPSRGMTEHERILWKARAHLLKDRSKRFEPFDIAKP